MTHNEQRNIHIFLTYTEEVYNMTLHQVWYIPPMCGNLVLDN